VKDGEEPPEGGDGDQKQEENGGGEEVTEPPEDDKCSELPDLPEKELIELCEYKAVCSNDGVTYGSLCIFCSAKRKENDIYIKHDGECDKTH
ncbi:hypothetical protein lerEdw1_016375, partial [Lerista edwardsae]